MYNLTDRQKEFAKWLIEQVRCEKLSEEFLVIWDRDQGTIKGFQDEHPEITQGLLDALNQAGLLHYRADQRTIQTPVQSMWGGQGTLSNQYETGRFCTLTGSAYEAVDSDFAEPDISFVVHLTPLADITHLDNEIKTRCLPILGTDSADPKLWDSAVRTAGVILEERLRSVGGISNPNRVGQNLVNDVFGSNGTLASKFKVDSERQGYRDLYSGIVGAIRNPFGHRLIDPGPQDAGATLVFIS
jgi:hypothetical protein